MITPLFADAPNPSPTNILNVVAWLIVILAGISQAGSWFEARKQRLAQKRDVRLSDQPIEISKSPRRYNHDANELRFKSIDMHLEKHDAEISSLHEKLAEEIPAMERRINEAGEDRASETHKRINEILEAVSELRGEMKGKR